MKSGVTLLIEHVHDDLYCSSRTIAVDLPGDGVDKRTHFRFSPELRRPEVDGYQLHGEGRYSRPTARRFRQ